MAHIYWERRTLDDDPRLRQWLERESGDDPAGDYEPPLDVVETATEILLLLDLPGVDRGDIKIVLSQGTLIVAGRKMPGCAHREAAFHLAERSFGRFVRAVRLSGAFDAGGAQAALAGGELRIVLPKIDERRGREIRIEITGAG